MFNNPVTPQVFADRMTGKLADGSVVARYIGLVAEFSPTSYTRILEYSDQFPTNLRPFSASTLRKSLTQFASSRLKHQHTFVYRITIDPTAALHALALEFPRISWFYASNRIGDQFVIVSGFTNTKAGQAQVMNFKGGYHGLDKLPAGVI